MVFTFNRKDLIAKLEAAKKRKLAEFQKETARLRPMAIKQIDKDIEKLKRQRQAIVGQSSTERFEVTIYNGSNYVGRYSYPEQKITDSRNLDQWLLRLNNHAATTITFRGKDADEILNLTKE
jgi:hypothetical protein